MKTNLKNDSGFTLVELMVVVAIIGILSAVAIPNFKKYQAKSKTSEAKVQLSAAYTAQQSFFGDYGIYHNCLSYMGFDPSTEASARYYAVGFANAADIDGDDTTGTYSDAKSNGLGVECARDLAQGDGTTYFSAGKGAGGVKVDDTSITVAAAFGTAAGTCTEDGTGYVATDGSCLGTQILDDQSFRMIAAGVISTDGATAADLSKWSIDNNKKFSNDRTGY